jgi:hypothetical protein
MPTRMGNVTSGVLLALTLANAAMLVYIILRLQGPTPFSSAAPVLATPLAVASPSPTPAVRAAASPSPAAPGAAGASLNPPPIAPRTGLMVRVTGTDGEGVSLRSTPATGEPIRAWPEGTEMMLLGERQDVSGRAWTKVRDPDGNDGWVAAEFLTPGTVLPSPQPTPST